MSVQVVALNPVQFDAMRKVLSRDQFKRGMFQAIKRTTNAAARIVRDLVQEETYLNDKYAKRVIKSRVDGGLKGGDQLPVGHVEISHERVPLIGYQVRANKRTGVVALVSKERAPIVLRHAFQARLRTAAQAAGGFAGHVGIVTRKKRGRAAGAKITKRGYAERLPLEEELGPAVTDIVKRPDVTRETTKRLGNRLEKEIAGQIDRFTKGQPAA